VYNASTLSYDIWYHIATLERVRARVAQWVGLPNNSYKPSTNTAWVPAGLCKSQKGALGHQSQTNIYKKKIRVGNKFNIHSSQVVVILFIFIESIYLICMVPQRYHIATLERVRARVAQWVGLPNNSYKPSSNTAWVCAGFVNHKKVHSTHSSKW
jgi:hypothetical protein